MFKVLASVSVSEQVSYQEEFLRNIIARVEKDDEEVITIEGQGMLAKGFPLHVIQVTEWTNKDNKEEDIFSFHLMHRQEAGYIKMKVVPREMVGVALPHIYREFLQAVLDGFSIWTPPIK
jgi:hypothetical protein